MGTNLQAFYKLFYIGCLKTQKQQLHFVKINEKNKFQIIFLFSIRAGHVKIWQGASQYGQGAAPSEIGLAETLYSPIVEHTAGGRHMFHCAVVNLLSLRQFIMEDYHQHHSLVVILQANTILPSGHAMSTWSNFPINPLDSKN